MKRRDESRFKGSLASAKSSCWLGYWGGVVVVGVVDQ